jgi:hypothetical protein
MGRRRRDGHYPPQKKNSIQSSVGNEQNGYPVLDLNKTMINVTKALRNTHKTNLKEEISEKFIEKILNMVNYNVQMTQEILRYQKQRA